MARKPRDLGRNTATRSGKSAAAATAAPGSPIVFVVQGQRLLGPGPDAGLQRSGGAGATGETGAGDAGTSAPRRKEAVTLAVAGASARSGTDTSNATTERLVAVPGEDVVVFHVQGGPALVLHPETARDLMLAQGTQRVPVARSRSPSPSGGQPAAPAAGITEVTVPAFFTWPGLQQATPTAARGAVTDWLGRVVLQTVEVLTGFAKDEAVSFVASKAVRLLDEQVNAGVYALQPRELPAFKKTGQQPIQVPSPTTTGAAANTPILVMIHGTFVDTSSTFGKLWQQHPKAVDALFAAYGNRVYALDHPTVGLSPVANAITLVQALPAGACLHLVTHSRGGLVAEVLARVAHQPKLSAADLAFFAADGYQNQALELKQLAALVQSKGIQVQRVLRVACPARGTLLASKRLDAYLSVLAWTLKLAGVPVLPQLVDFLNEVARRRADPAQLPGIAAMIADTPLIDWLNSAPERINGDLRVVAGDLEGDSLTGWLKTLLADAYYWTDNDVVVQTRSMYGGSPRLGGALFLLDRGGNCTHFNYFANAKTVQAMLDGLTQLQPSGFAPIGPLSWAGQSSDGTRSAGKTRSQAVSKTVSAADAARPAVIVLPGILGSHLAAGGDRIWLSWRLVGGLHKLQYTGQADGVLPDGAIGMVYDDLKAHLASSHAVTEFAFDWRRPIEQEAERLADEIDRQLAARSTNKQPVRLLAHSMGGLVARTVQLVRPKTFNAWLAVDGARLLMLGTPNGGSWAPMQVLSGDDTMGNALASFGSPLRNHEARQWMAQMPGFLQLQAQLTDPTLNLADHNTWARLAEDDLKQVQQANWWHHSAGEAPDAAYAWGLPSQAVLDQAVALRRRLDQQVQNDLPSFAAKLLLVVGQAPFTPNGFELGDGGFVYLDAPQGGDGRVPLHQALLPGVKTWRLDCEHGSMPDADGAFAAFTELLSSGATSRLMALDTSSQAAAGTGARAASAGATQPARSRPSRGLLPTTNSAQPAGDARSVMVSNQVSNQVSTQGSTQFGAPTRADTGLVRAGRGGPAAALQVTVLNGNLGFVSQPLLVGHTWASVLTGSEAVVDGLIGGGMTTSLLAGLYPDAPGSHQVFVNTRREADNPWRNPQPSKVVVLGLGAEGKLTEQDLTHTVRQGVLALLQRQSNAAAYGQPVDEHLDLAATLMGSGGAGMNPSTAARAIASGVAQANAAIAYTQGGLQSSLKGGAGWPHVAHLTLVELYLERASDAWAGLQVLADSAPGRYAITPTIASGVGPLRRQLDSGYRGTDHDFISATGGNAADGASSIAFRLDTKRARTEITAQSTQGQLLRNLVALASDGRTTGNTGGNTDSDRGASGGHLGRTLFQLLVPPALEPFLSGTNRMVLELDGQTAPIPWELLETPNTDPDPGLAQATQQRSSEPWAIRTQLLRKLRTDTFRQAVRDANLEDAVLVVGEPEVDPKRYAPLLGALHEAQAVAKELTDVLHAQQVTLLTGANSATVINTLFARNYRIVHIAGHGEPPSHLADNPDAKPDGAATPNKGGVVLSEGCFLGPDEIRSMRCVPELVFVNCCHLAKRDTADVLAQASTRFSRPAFAYGVADELINMGVRCVIAAGWAVDDGPAKAFAEAFYGALMKGSAFIEAVTRGRRAALKSDSRSSTWAAYQCYGDPNWTFNPGTAAASKPVAPKDEFAGVSSPLGLALALEDVAVRSEFMGGKKAEQQARIQYLEDRFAGQWGGMGAVAEAFAVAHQSLRQHQHALAWYQRALLCADASASIKVQEQRGNLMARVAWSQAQAAKPSDKAALASACDSITQALRDLQLLASLHPTEERHSLCGSAYKRLGQLHTKAGDSAAARAAFSQAAQQYAKAEAMAQKSGSADLFYPAMNRMALELVQHRKQKSWPGFDAAQTNRVKNSLTAKMQAAPDFWAYAAWVELDLMQALASDQLKQQHASLAQAFEALHGRAAGSHLWASVADQAAWLLSGDTSREAQQLLAQLRGYAA